MPFTPRQRELMHVGARLFAESGYHAVGINDISAELGLTGPAFYRHFPSKEALLIAVLDEAISTHLEEVRDLTHDYAGKPGVLEAMVDHHLAFTVAEGDAITVWRTEARVLPEADRKRIGYLQRLYLDEWARATRDLRKDLSNEEVQVLVRAVIALLQAGIRFHMPLAGDDLHVVLKASALQCLLETKVPATRR